MVTLYVRIPRKHWTAIGELNLSRGVIELKPELQKPLMKKFRLNKQLQDFCDKHGGTVEELEQVYFRMRYVNPIAGGVTKPKRELRKLFQVMEARNSIKLMPILLELSKKKEEKAEKSPVS